jgi:hypothetical protein
VRKHLDDTEARISSHAIAQVAGRRESQGETAKQHQLRLVLRKRHMSPIAVIARQKLREQPEFTLLRMPPWKLRGGGFSPAAHDMIDAAEKYSDLFIEAGLLPDFVARFRAALNQFDESIDARGQGRVQRAGATEGLKAETRRARALIRVLDSLVRPMLDTNDALVREWEVATHIRRKPTPVTTTADVPPTLAAAA